ncbi:septal ring lytic transglycosylase RlpA family protein [Pseudomarimonas salicorniae]|uniref:septal ring lytic transglycosylase RlpA family protein n=1 Tax=Pseudomarimonas salicorniae TaxID=2933270 RepID=UPI00249EF2F5|nr:septal ring lytic transglycosylase RlpA family protein [Lysobacter sp. CAU 1642]
MRGLALLLGILLLAGCASGPRKAPLPERESARARPQTGELYAPHIPDGGPALPPDLRGIAEPIPVPEPRSRYGNRSPYKVLGKTYQVMEDARGYRERGIASWYGNKFHGRPTSSFEPYDMYKYTAAHKTLPLPSFARVTNLENGRSVVVRVNDRGPFHAGRIIDLSYVAAVKLGIHLRGTAEVEVESIDAGDTPTLVAGDPGERRHRSGFGAPVAAGGGRLYLQVASFSDKANARRLKDRLEDADVGRVHLEKAEIGRRDVWRVRIGPLRSAADVDPVRRTLFRLGLGEPQQVREF